MSDCPYCGCAFRTTDIRIKKFGRQYHMECFVARVHDMLIAVKMNAQVIVDTTQDVNAKANAHARRILDIIGDE